MKKRYVAFLFAAVLLAAACDSSTENPGTEPTSTPDVSTDTGKGDDPYPPTTAPDSNGSNDTMVAETINTNQCPPSVLTDGGKCTPGNCTLKRFDYPDCGWQCFKAGESIWAVDPDEAETFCTTGQWPQ